MSFRVDTASLIANAWVVGVPGLGVTPAQIPDQGPDGPSVLWNDKAPGDESKEFRLLITTPPGNGNLFVKEDGSFTFTGSSTSWAYTLYVDGVSVGTATVSMTLGSSDVLAGVTLSHAQSANVNVVNAYAESVTFAASLDELTSGGDVSETATLSDVYATDAISVSEIVSEQLTLIDNAARFEYSGVWGIVDPINSTNVWTKGS